jgi:hypothetical protein
MPIDLTEYDEDAVALSPSAGFAITNESPLVAWWFHRLLGGHRKKDSDATISGKLFHAGLLEDGAGIEVIDADAFRTKDAKAARDLAIAKGLIPIVKPKWEAMQPTLERIKESIENAGYSLGIGKCEARIQWTEPADNATGGVVCHARLDWISHDCLHIIDLKTTEGSVHPDTCAAKLVREGGALQEAANIGAISRLFPELAGRIDFTFLFIQTKEPFDVVPIESDGSMRELGEAQWQRAVKLWAECMESGKWPGHSTGRPVRVGAPAWALAREMMMEDAA